MDQCRNNKANYENEDIDKNAFFIWIIRCHVPFSPAKTPEPWATYFRIAEQESKFLYINRIADSPDESK